MLGLLCMHRHNVILKKKYGKNGYPKFSLAVGKDFPWELSLISTKLVFVKHLFRKVTSRFTLNYVCIFFSHTHDEGCIVSSESEDENDFTIESIEIRATVPPEIVSI